MSLHIAAILTVVVALATASPVQNVHGNPSVVQRSRGGIGRVTLENPNINVNKLDVSKLIYESIDLTELDLQDLDMNMFTPESMGNGELQRSGNANFFMDMVLRKVNKLLPAKVDLPDVGTMFNLHDCYVFGLDNGLKRSGDATMVTKDGSVKFTCGVTTGLVGLSCKWRFLLLWGKLSGTTDIITIDTGINMKLSSGSSPQLTEFRVIELADIKTDITGLTVFVNWIAEDLADIVLKQFKGIMITVVETVAQKVVQQVLDKIVMP